MCAKSFARIVVLAGCLLATQANAMPILVDFASGTWTGADGSPLASRAYGGVIVSLTPTGGLLSLSGSDGAGVGDVEIGDNESLEVGFSSPVTVLSFHIQNLLLGPGPGASTQERFSADFGSSNHNGEGTVTGNYDAIVNLTGIDSILFRASGRPGNDFSLAAIWIDDGRLASATSRVPEPGPLPLLAAGLLLAGIWPAIRRSGHRARHTL